MTNFKLLPVTLLLTVALLTGCCPDKGAGSAKTEPKSGATSAAAPEAPAAPNAATQNNNGALIVAPSVLRECDLESGKGAVVHVKWALPSGHGDTAKITVSAPASEPKLWLDGAAQGEQDTGPWVHPGSKFTLLDTDGTVVSTVLVGMKKCP
jgi:hypothetical protein